MSAPRRHARDDHESIAPILSLASAAAIAARTAVFYNTVTQAPTVNAAITSSR